MKGVRKILRALLAVARPSTRTVALRQVLFGANRQADSPIDRYRPIADEAGDRAFDPALVGA